MTAASTTDALAGPPVSVTLPEGWGTSTDGAWSLADAPDHRAHVRIATYGKGVLTDGDAEGFLTSFIESWPTYTVDRHVRHVTCGHFVGVEVSGHGAGDGWERARFHLFLLVDPAASQKGAVVLITGRDDAWEAVHPALDRAVHGAHG